MIQDESRVANARSQTEKETKRFKVGDKVYVHPARPSFVFKHYIRASITGVENDGYRLRAFVQDLPGVWMYNIWDADLLPREGRAKKLLPVESTVH